MMPGAAKLVPCPPESIAALLRAIAYCIVHDVFDNFSNKRTCLQLLYQNINTCDQKRYLVNCRQDELIAFIVLDLLVLFMMASIVNLINLLCM